MVKITKVYTRTGDTGQTGLVGGKRLPKDHPRIEAYGSVDELNRVLGIVLSFLVQKDASKRRDKLGLILEAIQQKLLTWVPNWQLFQVMNMWGKSLYRRKTRNGLRK